MKGLRARGVNEKVRKTLHLYVCESKSVGHIGVPKLDHLKMDPTIPFAQQSERVKFSYCAYSTSI